jgi:hypothetical protein
MVKCSMKLSIERGKGETYTITPDTTLTIGVNRNKRFGAVERGAMRGIMGGSAGGGMLEV